MFTYPNINPVAIHIGPLKIYWYGLMYVIGFFSAWGLALWRTAGDDSVWTADQVGDLIFYSAIGVVLGGRIGYILFYNLSGFFADPLIIFKTWLGGMSFHGGVIGVVIAIWLYSKKHQQSFLQIGDFVSPLVPIGLGLGRIGNFINGELWGRVTTMPWGMFYQ